MWGEREATKNPDDKYVFKVPTLRNVAMTGPYFHDGSIGSLEDAVRAIARLQLGVVAGDKQIRDIVAFLTSLDRRPRLARFIQSLSKIPKWSKTKP